MRPLALGLGLASVVVSAGAAGGADYAQTITLREPLGYTWTDEMVHRDVRIAENRVAAGTFALLDATGNAVPVQVEVLEGGPDAVRRARLWLKTTLPKDREISYRLTYNDDGRAAKAPGQALTVVREADRLILSTGAAQVAIPAPAERFAKPLDLQAAPAPILAVRPAGDETWYGRWRLQGPARVSQVKTTVTAQGPVRAEIRIEYVFQEKTAVWEVTLRAVQGEPWIDVDEKYRLGTGARATLVLKDRLKPSEVLWLPWFVERDGGVRPAYDLRRDRLADPPPDAPPLATLRPRWTQSPDCAQVCLAVGPGDGRPTVGVVMTCPGDWARPYGQFPTVRAVEGGAGMAIEFPLVEGRRRWALLAGPVKRFDSKGELQGLVRRLADIPLDRVLNEWILAWPRDAARPAPHVLTTLERLQAIREAVAAGADTPAARLVTGIIRGERPGDRELADFLAGRRERMPDDNLDVSMYLGRSYHDAFLAPSAYPQRLAAALPRADLSAAGGPASDAAAALLGYVFTDRNYWPGRSGGWDAGTPAYQRSMVAVPLMAAAMMPDHPHARRWMDQALAAVRHDLARTLATDDGVGAECPGAQAAALADLVPLLRAAQNSGLADPFEWPEVRASLEFLRHLHTPPDPRLGRRALAPLGDTAPWQDGVGRLFGMAAAGVARTDPKLAATWMAMYRAYYGDAGSGDLAADVLLTDPSAPATPLAEADWGSRAFKGFGAVLRSRFGTPREAFATLKCGTARGRYHGDELSFHFFGAGMPVALDWYSGDAPRPEQEHMHNRVNVGDDENMDAVGTLLAMATSDAGDVAVGQARSNRLRRMPRYPHEIVAGGTFPRRGIARGIRYRRFLLLVKHAETSPLEDYLVIRDELAADEPATFNLFVLARSVRQEGETFVFDGQLAADAVLYLATPVPEKVALARWAWPRQDASSLIGDDFRPGTDRWTKGELQQWVRVTEMPGRPFLAVLYPFRKGTTPPAFQTLTDGKGVRVTLGKASEEVFLATDPPGGVGGQAVVRRGGRETVVLKAKAVPPL
ncbi:MAG TPA: hypothetical protein VM431_03475 [Phycisphaerae bacterium]|nr:hypothetical protein [Phycisphaerae bacterium]